MNTLTELIRERFGPLMERERQRLRRWGADDCELPPKRQPWEVTRVIRGFEGDEWALRGWMHQADAESVRPIVCGYDDLITDLERGQQEARALAVELLQASLCVACAHLCTRWMLHKLSPPDPADNTQHPGQHG